jgi:hypothetical protein
MTPLAFRLLLVAFHLTGTGHVRSYEPLNGEDGAYATIQFELPFGGREAPTEVDVRRLIETQS